ncbi:MAG: serine hydrolase domain-containing protein [Candidatus Cybelea sp.]
MKFVAAFLIPAFVAAGAGTQPDPSLLARVDSSVQAIVASAHVPSISIAIARDGTLVYSRAYGYANLARHTPATEQTHYEIGSITKQFTATAILQLKEAGKLSLSDTLARWIPEYRRAARVTIRELLQQTTGIPEYTDSKGFDTMAGTRTPSFAAILALVRSKPLKFRPGSRFAYSNTNYILLGEILERASGISWETYVRTHLFVAAGMTHSGFIDDEAHLQPMASGYVAGKNGVKLAPPLRSGWAWSAGAIVSTTGDMLEWDSALLRGRLINQTDLAAMLAPGKPAFGKGSWYGYGWVIDTADGHKRIWHNGGTFGFNAANLLFPRDGLAIVVLQNADTIAAAESTGTRIFEAFEPSAAQAADASASGEDPAITERVRDLLAQLESGTVDRTQLNATMNKRLTPQLLKAAATELAVLGVPQRLVFVGKATIGSGTLYTYRAVFSAATFNVKIGVDRFGKVIGFVLLP